MAFPSNSNVMPPVHLQANKGTQNTNTNLLGLEDKSDNDNCMADHVDRLIMMERERVISQADKQIQMIKRDSVLRGRGLSMKLGGLLSQSSFDKQSLLLEDNLLDEAIGGDEDLLKQFEFNDRLLSFEEAMTSNFENEPSLI